MDDRTNKARIAANVAKMQAANAPESDIETYIQSEGLSPVASDPNAGLHAEYASGALDRRMQAANAAEDTSPTEAGWGQKIAGGLSAGLGIVPGGQAVMAGARSVARRQPYSVALSEIEGAQREAPAAIKLPAQAAGLVGSMAAVPLRALQGGRVAGAAVGAGMAGAQRALDATPESVASRIKGTLGAGAVGGAIGGIAPWAMAHTIPRTVIGAGVGGAAGAVMAPDDHRLAGLAGGAVAGGTMAAKPSATANLISKGAEAIGRRVSGLSGLASKAATGLRSISEATGLKGLANAENEGIDQLAKPVGSMVGAQGPAAGQKVAEAARFEATSKRLFEIAKQDKKMLNDPAIIAMVNDPDIRAGFAAVSRIRSEAGDALPQAVVGQKQVASKVLGPNGQPVMRTEGVMSYVPDPEGLHLLKRIVQEAQDKSFQGERVIPYEDAIRIAPKLAHLRDILHSRSPDYKRADQAFQLGRAAQEAYDAGIGAVKPAMRNPSPTKTGVADVQGLTAAVGKVRNSDSQQEARLRAVIARGNEQGGKAQIAQQIAAKGVSGGRKNVLTAPALEASGPAAEQRAMALGTDAMSFEKTLGNVRADASENKGASLFLPWNVRLGASLAGLNLNAAPLQGGEAQRLLGRAVDNPQAYQKVLAEYGHGTKVLTLAERLAQILGGSAAVRGYR